MGCTTDLFRVATGGKANTIAGPLRNINVFAAVHKDFGILAECPYLEDRTMEYPNGDRKGQAGWDVAVSYTDLDDLARKLEAGIVMEETTKRRFGDRCSEPIQPGEITRLAIMAHGGQAGVWYPNGKWKGGVPVTVGGSLLPDGGATELLERWRVPLERIGKYTRAQPVGSTIILMGCMAGQGKGGTELLMALSEIWPGQKVVGFDVIGYRDSGMAYRGNSLGGEYVGMKLTWFMSDIEFEANQRRNHDEIGKRWDELEWASEFSKDHAKIVRDQRLIKCPAEEKICPEDGVYPTPPKPAKGVGGSGPAKPAGKASPAQSYPASWARPPAKPR
jgi:hypothetical protein